MDRRDVLKLAGGTFLGGAACAYAFHFLVEKTSGKAVSDSPESGAGAVPIETGERWGMLIDLNKCNACQECNDSELKNVPCVLACRRENNVGYYGDDLENIPHNVFWIRRVLLKQEGESHAATKEEESEPQTKYAILMCNHCDNPPCAQVCPVQATYRRDDGVVIVDHHRCIGCRYCMIACPYNARWFNFKDNEGPFEHNAFPIEKFPDTRELPQPKRSHGVAESCTLCAHRIGDWKRRITEDPKLKEEEPAPVPACVEACQEIQGDALMFGNLDDPESEIAKAIASNSVKRIRDDLGTEPKVYYVGF